MFRILSHLPMRQSLNQIREGGLVIIKQAKLINLSNRNVKHLFVQLLHGLLQLCAITSHTKCIVSRSK